MIKLFIFIVNIWSIIINQRSKTNILKNITFTRIVTNSTFDNYNFLLCDNYNTS